MTARRLIKHRRRLARRLLVAVALAVALVLLAHPLAAASDVLSNVAPASQLPSGSLTNAYPYGNYELDHHFDAVSASFSGGVDASGVAPTIAWFLAQLVWSFTALMASAVITLFTFAFSLDLVNGSSATGGAGALVPVATAVRSIYRDTFGEPWLIVAILLTGLWAIWHALVRRRYTETASALGISVLFIVIALAFVARPEIIGEASRLTNQVSGAFLALSSHGSLANQSQAKQANADQLFARLIYEPWVVLNFGGLEHCVTGGGDDQRSVPVRPLSRDPGRDSALARTLAAGTQVQADGKLCINNANKYAARFLRFAPETALRKLEYEALKAGDTSKLTPLGIQRADDGYRLSDADKPAAEAMDKGGQYQRLLLAVVIFLGELGAFLLLGAVAVAVIIAQVLVVLLLAFAPVALVVGVLPGRGHEFFMGWLARLASYLLRKAIYSLLLAILLTVAGALADATSNLGWLLAFGLQAVFFWTVLLNRRQLVGQLSHVATGHGRVESDGLGRAAIATYTAARLATRHLRQRGGATDPHHEHSHRHAGDAPRELPPESGDPKTEGPDHGGPAPSGPLPGDGPADTSAAPAVSSNTTSTRYGTAPAEADGATSDIDADEQPALHSASTTDATADEEGRERRRPDGTPNAQASPDRDGREPAQESRLRRHLRDDARRLRREGRRLGEEAQQLAEVGRRLRREAQRAHGPAHEPHERPVSRNAAPREAPVEPASAPPPPLDDGEAQR
jgi:hypothetical protein